jgi:hypothetical protein
LALFCTASPVFGNAAGHLFVGRASPHDTPMRAGTLALQSCPAGPSGQIGFVFADAKSTSFSLNSVPSHNLPLIPAPTELALFCTVGPRPYGRRRDARFCVSTSGREGPLPTRPAKLALFRVIASAPDSCQHPTNCGLSLIVMPQSYNHPLWASNKIPKSPKLLFTTDQHDNSLSDGGLRTIDTNSARPGWAVPTISLATRNTESAGMSRPTGRQESKALQDRLWPMRFDFTGIPSATKLTPAQQWTCLSSPAQEAACCPVPRSGG